MRAEIIAVGSEMLGMGRLDSNGDWLAHQLGRSGVEVIARSLVGDDADDIAGAVRTALQRSDLVILSGGLGPTEDDRTREALALALARPLESDAACLARLEQRFRERERVFTAVQHKQAERPEGSEWIENPLGSAPGILAVEGEHRLYAFPGVPQELKPMFTEAVLPWIAQRGGRSLTRRVLKVAGRTEASVDEQVRDLYDLPGIAVTILTGREGIELHLVSRGESESQAQERLEEADRRMRDRLGADLYGRDEESLPDLVGRLLAEQGRTVATAESCTAGLLGAALTSVPGSSLWYRGGLVVYSDDLKRRLAGVQRESLVGHGAVSEQVCRELARGARERCSADIGVGITGIAGPGGAGRDKPVGLVHLAIAEEREVHHWRTLQFGDRNLVRHRTVTATLDRLRRLLMGKAWSGEGPA